MIVRWFVVSGLALLPAAAVACLQPCSEAQKLQLEEAARLHLALAPECALARDQLAAMQSRNSCESPARSSNNVVS